MLLSGHMSGPAGSATRKKNMTCVECREQMCTDVVLNRLRCADCRHIKFEELYRFVLNLSLMAIAGFVAWLFTRDSD